MPESQQGDMPRARATQQRYACDGTGVGGAGGRHTAAPPRSLAGGGSECGGIVRPAPAPGGAAPGLALPDAPGWHAAAIPGLHGNRCAPRIDGLPCVGDRGSSKSGNRDADADVLRPP